jgi:hypothetical protein
MVNLGVMEIQIPIMIAGKLFGPLSRKVGINTPFHCEPTPGTLLIITYAYGCELVGSLMHRPKVDMLCG